MQVRQPIFIFFLFLTSLTRAAVDMEMLKGYFAEQRFEELQNTLPEAAAIFPNHPNIAFYQAYLNVHSDSAVAQYKKVLSAKPPSDHLDQALMRLGQYSFSIGEYKRARSYLAALFKFPRSSLRDDAQYLYCQCVLAEGLLDSARIFLNAFIQNINQSPFIDNAILDLESLGGAVSPAKPSRDENGGFYYTIQIASYKSSAEAENAGLKLNRLFSHVEVVKRTLGGSRYWAVHVGKFKSEEKAERYAELYIKPHLKEYKIVEHSR